MTFNLTLEVTALVDDTGLRAQSVQWWTLTTSKVVLLQYIVNNYFKK